MIRNSKPKIDWIFFLSSLTGASFSIWSDSDATPAARSSLAEVCTHPCSWCTRSSRSPCCRWPDWTRWCWWARTHTCGAGCPWRVGGRWGRRRSGRRRWGSSHPRASSQTGSGRQRWSSGLESSHTCGYTNLGVSAVSTPTTTNEWWVFYYF